MTVEKYDSFSTKTQAQIIADALQGYYQLYNGDTKRRYMAACMVELYKPPTEGAAPKLLSLIYNQLELARDDGSAKHTVEGVVERVIDRECKDRR